VYNFLILFLALNANVTNVGWVERSETQQLHYKNT